MECLPICCRSQELDRIGYAGERPCGGQPVHAFFEAHIEQGPLLEANGCVIGVSENRSEGEILASIPAGIILAIIYLIAAAVLGGIFSYSPY